MPVSSISVLGSRSAKAGGLRWDLPPVLDLELLARLEVEALTDHV